uniref:MYND-type domain-containing protein n=1 Tax=Neobodo designis TaxID=312471 RepID=A0A6U4RJU7_NEODS
MRAGDRVVINGLPETPELNGRVAFVHCDGHSMGQYAVVPEGTAASVRVFVDKLSRAPARRPHDSANSEAAAKVDTVVSATCDKSTANVSSASATATPHCAACGEPASKRCAACHGPSYCGVACQKAHWKSHHKRECKKQ